MNSKTETREPKDFPVFQQRMKAWTPILNPVWVITLLYAIGIAFVPLGLQFNLISDDVVEYKRTYDSYKVTNQWTDACGIDTANENRTCTIAINVDKDMKGPIMVYYEIDNFYQNHREYSTSRDDEQLLGLSYQSSIAASTCEPLNKIGNITLNPCGFIANTFFNDVIKFIPSGSQTGASWNMQEHGIAWESDLEYKFRQPEKFRYLECSSCSDVSCDCSIPQGGQEWSCTVPYKDPNENDKCFLYFYPDDETTKYLYETYPIISPIEGVTNEHFVVWMRIAAEPKFRKLYGYFSRNIAKGETLTFEITNNWIVKSFHGSKSLIITTTSALGGKNYSIGNSFIAVGGVCLAFATFFALKHIFKPRKLGHDKYLKYRVE